MNAVNRVVIVILLLVAMMLCSAVLVLPAFEVPLLEAAAEQLMDWADFVASLYWYIRVPLAILFALTLDVILLLILVLEVRRPKAKSIRVEKAGGGEVQVSIASIADRLKYEVDQLSSVLRSKPKVSAKRSGVVVELDVETAAGINVPQKAEQIVETAQRVVEEKMGLKLARPPKVNLRAVPYPKTPRGPARPVVEPQEKPPAVPYFRAPEAPKRPEDDLPVLLED